MTTLHPRIAPILDRVAELADDGLVGLVILDLDSTALTTSFRQHRILADFATQHPALRAVVADIRPEEIGFLVETPLLRRGIDDPELLAALRRFWASRFFSDPYCRLDRPNLGAPELARAIVSRGGLVYYLTARSRTMKLGTIEVLDRFDFPVLRGRAVLHMRPPRGGDDAAFKRGAMDEIRALGHPVVATFENEPKHAHTYLEAFPDAVHVLFGDICSPSAPEPDPQLLRLPSFV